MSCFKPLRAVITGEKTKTGKREIKVVGQKDVDIVPGGQVIALPCGQCIGCRITKSMDMATRCVHEAQMHDDNCFITLTYSPENLPPDGGLIKRDFVLFMKKLRRHFEPKRFKMYMCGEYGDKNNRPHYHALLFGLNFDDWVYLFDSPGGQPIYMSPTLEQIWGYGFVTLGTLTFESAAYVARYCMKKINGPQAEAINEKTGLKHYERFNSFTGEIVEVWPEYSTGSHGGRYSRGLGYDWINKYKSDCYPKDYTTIRGKRVKPSKYYDRYLEEIDPDMYDDVKAKRELSLSEQFEEMSRNRLSQKEKVKIAQTQQLKRNL